MPQKGPFYIKPPKGRSAEVEAEMGYRLRQVDHRLYNDGTKERLLVNSSKHKPARLHFFCPSLVNPDPWDEERWLKVSVHPKSGKKRDSRGKKK